MISIARSARVRGKARLSKSTSWNSTLVPELPAMLYKGQRETRRTHYSIPKLQYASRIWQDVATSHRLYQANQI